MSRGEGRKIERAGEGEGEGGDQRERGHLSEL